MIKILSLFLAIGFLSFNAHADYIEMHYAKASIREKARIALTQKNISVHGATKSSCLMNEQTGKIVCHVLQIIPANKEIYVTGVELVICNKNPVYSVLTLQNVSCQTSREIMWRDANSAYRTGYIPVSSYKIKR